MVVPEGTETMPRAGEDYPMRSTIKLSAASEEKKIKSHRAVKVSTYFYGSEIKIKSQKCPFTGP